MKFPILVVLLASIIASCSSSRDQIVLTKDAVSDYTILLSAEPDSLTLMAANELQHYVFTISEARLNIANKITDGNKFIAVGKSFIRDSATVSKLEALDEDGFIKISTDDKVFLDCGDIFVSNTGEGGADETEPAVRGQSLQDWLQTLLDDYNAHIHPTGVGPSGPPMPPTPATVAKLSSTHINYQQKNK